MFRKKKLLKNRDVPILNVVGGPGGPLLTFEGGVRAPLLT